MGKKRSKKPDYQIDLIREKGQPNENFFRLYRSLFENERFRKLPSTAKLVYFAIGLQCGREDSDRMSSCKLPESQYTALGFSKKQWEKAVPYLEENGFIKVERFKSRLPNTYRLSDEWKNKNQ